MSNNNNDGDTDIYLPLYYVVRVGTETYRLFNRATDAVVLECEPKYIIEEFLKDNDSKHPFVLKAEKKRSYEYFSNHTDIFEDRHTSTSDDIVMDVPITFDSIFAELEGRLSNQNGDIFDYEINGFESINKDSVSSNFSFEVSSPALSVDFLNEIERLSEPAQLSFDFSFVSLVPNLVPNLVPKLDIETKGVYPKVDPFEPAEDADEDIPYLPED
jgi:hypothetical protein